MKIAPFCGMMAIIICSETLAQEQQNSLGEEVITKQDSEPLGDSPPIQKNNISPYMRFSAVISAYPYLQYSVDEQQGTDLMSIFRGGGVSLGLGVDINRSFRAELAGDYRYEQIGQPSNSGTDHFWSANINVYKDFKFADDFPIGLYIGAGFGVSGLYGRDLIVGDISQAGDRISQAQIDSDIIGININGLAGLSYDVSKDFSFDVGYKYTWMPGVRANVQDSIIAHTVGYSNHSITAGLVWRFDVPKRIAELADIPLAKPLKIAPPPPPPLPYPVISCASQDQNFTVYFPVNSTDLADADLGKVRKAVAKAVNNDCAVVAVSITGYTDRSGDPDYNKKLSELRANSVRGVLIAAGINASIIKINAAGESDPANHHQDGSTDAISRRAEVYIRVN